MLRYVAGDRNRFARDLFTPLPQRYDRLAEILSMGQNGRWRRALVDRVAPHSPARVLDVASGTAGVAIELANRTSSDIVAVDLTQAMLLQGRANVARLGLSDRIGLVVGKAEHLPFPDASFDALMFTYLLRYVDDPAATLQELSRAVRRGVPAGKAMARAHRAGALWRQIGGRFGISQQAAYEKAKLWTQRHRL